MDSEYFNLTKLGGLPVNVKTIIVFVIIIATQFALYYNADVNYSMFLDTKKEIENIQQEIKLAENNSSNEQYTLDKINKGYNPQQTKVLIPDNINVEHSIKNLANYAFKSNVLIKNIKMKTEKVSGSFVEIPSSIILSGSYDSLVKFISNAEFGNIFLDIKKITINKTNNITDNILELKLSLNLI